MRITPDLVQARIGGCYELKPTVLHRRRIVKKNGWVPQDVIRAALRNSPPGARYITYRDRDGDGFCLIYWKQSDDLIQPHCGHPVSAIVRADDGTNYCSICERDNERID